MVSKDKEKKRKGEELAKENKGGRKELKKESDEPSSSKDNSEDE